MRMKILVRRILSHLPIKLINNLELFFQSLSGKGWVAGIKTETELVHSIAISNSIVKPVVYDVGANIGEWSSEFLKMSSNASIHMFEPSKQTFKVLEKRFENLPNTKLNNFALGSKNQSRELYSDSQLSGLASLNNRDLNFLGINFTHTEKVRVRSLDDYLKHNAPPDIIKIDVEGHELEVLKGATKTLKLAKIVEFEFGGANVDSRTYFKDFFYFFKSKEFEIFRLTAIGLFHLTEYQESDECFRNTTYVCISTRLTRSAAALK